MAPEWTRIASDSRRRSPPERPSTGFSAASPENRNWPSSARALGGVRRVARWAASSTVAVASSSSACWESTPSLTLWPVRSLPSSSSRAPASAEISVVLPDPLGPISETCSPRSSHSSASRSSSRSPIRSVASSISNTTRPGALGRLEGEAEALAVARVAGDALHLVELLRARLRLAGAGAGAEAGHEALEPLDLLLLALDRAPERELARRLLLAPGVPRALEELRAAGLELEHRGADRLEEPAVVGDEHDGGVERLQVALEPLERGDVEVVGRLVEQQQVGVARERAGERRARELAAGERRERAVEVLVAEAEAVQRRVDLVAPAVAAGVLEPRLGGRVGAERGRVGRALGHRRLELGQALLDRQQLLGAAEHVVAQRQLALARRALVVQGDPRALGEHELAAVDRGLPREHPQQRRLARAVAPGQRQALPALEPERHAAQQRLPHHVLGEV